MMTPIYRLITSIVLGTVAFSANATTYNVQENFNGTFTVADLGDGIFQTTNNLYFESLSYGDASLFSSSVTALIPFDSNSNTLCSTTCIFTEYLLNGDSFFGTFSFTYFHPVSDNLNAWVTNIYVTGGTGLFTGAIGSGTAYGTISNGFSGDIKQTSMFNICVDERCSFGGGGNGGGGNGGGGNGGGGGSAGDVSAVPLPATLPLMFSGLGVLGLAARRNKR